MDNGVEQQWALSSGLWASLAPYSLVGGLRHPLPLHTPGGERPLLLPGSYSECSQGSLRTTKSSLGSTGQPHPTHSHSWGPEGTCSDKPSPETSPQPRAGEGGGWVQGGSQELQTVPGCSQGTDPWGHMHWGHEFTTHSLRRSPFLSGVETSGMGDERQWWPAHLPGPCWEPREGSICGDSPPSSGPSVQPPPSQPQTHSRL